MYSLHTSIEITAPPETVRAKFLDFQQLLSYHPNGIFKSLTPTIPNKPLEPGDKMHNVLEGMTFDPIVLENSPSAFVWRGSFLGIFVGEHAFRFEPSKSTPGSTTFVQEENFTGIFAWTMGEGFLANGIGFKNKTKNGFEGYNRDLKASCEGTKNVQ